MRSLSATEQLDLFGKFISDPRSRIATGFDELDVLLRRGGFAPGELVLLGGVTQTRKTVVALNMITHMLSAGVQVGVVGLDEPLPSYIGKLMSAMTGAATEKIEDGWPVPSLYQDYEKLASNMVMFDGDEPTLEELTQWMMESEIDAQVKPEIVFIDYAALVKRDKYAGADVQRVPRLMQALKIWGRKEEVVTIALHHIGRTDEWGATRYHGEGPATLQALKYGGEEVADIVLATYRPSHDPYGNMSYDMARKVKGDKFDEAEWQVACERVSKYQDYTYLQLLKNRPGTKLHLQGLPLRSMGESMKMQYDASILDTDKVKAYGGNTSD